MGTVYSYCRCCKYCQENSEEKNIKKNKKAIDQPLSIIDNERYKSEDEKEKINKLNEEESNLDTTYEKKKEIKNNLHKVNENKLNEEKNNLHNENENKLNEEKNNLHKNKLNGEKNNLHKEYENKLNEEKSNLHKEYENKLNEEKNNLHKEYENKLNEEKNNLHKEYENKLKEQEKAYDDKLKKLEIELKKKEEKIKGLDNSIILIGLNNIGATCYMNATLQALSNTNDFTKYFLNDYNYNPKDISKKMSNEFYNLLNLLWDKNKKKGSFSPNDFKETLSKENPLFQGIQANDSKDLITFLLERLHSELNQPDNSPINGLAENQFDEMHTLNLFYQDYQRNYKSMISNLFYGVIEIKNQCTGCNYIKFNFQIFNFLEFPLEQVNNFCFQNGKRMALVNSDGTNPDINLYECFDYYQKVELMSGDNQMYCNVCNATLNAYYSSTIYSAPKYLIINLNRGRNAVYQCKIYFPETLKLFKYVINTNGNTEYELYAVISHIGPSSMEGHFVAYCRNRMDDKWYLYNDAFVNECTKAQEYYNGMPYILFYRAK